MNTQKFIAFLSFSLLFVSNPVWAGQDEAMKGRLAEFFNVSPDQIYIECDQNTYQLGEEGGMPVLNVCLNKVDQKKRRCEITVHGLKRSPSVNKISYDINIADTTPHKEWESVMQIHSFPDKGEAWRCPVTALEAEKGAFRIFNRWDASPLSTTYGYNCAEPGSSISSRNIIKDVDIKPGQWQKVELNLTLSTGADGRYQAIIDNANSGMIEGPNTYNDQKLPFVKFGIYKPTSWEDDHQQTCVKYRNVKIVTGND